MKTHVRYTFALLLALLGIAEAPTATLAESHFLPSSRLRIAADTLPVKGLVDAVANGHHEVELIVGPNVSAHDFNLRPSDARKLVHADLIVHMNADLPPWLLPTLDKIAADTPRTALPSAPGVPALDSDPHTWLDPENAVHWLQLIASQLAALDPANASQYQTNANQAAAGIRDAQLGVETQSQALAAVRWLNYHDSLSWFSQRFQVTPVDVVFNADDQPPSPASFAAIRKLIRDGEVDCLLAEPGLSQRARASLDDSGRLRIVTIDPMGRDLPEGAEHYPALLASLSDAINRCSAG